MLPCLLHTQVPNFPFLRNDSNCSFCLQGFRFLSPQPLVCSPQNSPLSVLLSKCITSSFRIKVKLSSMDSKITDELTSLKKLVLETLLPVASYLVPYVFMTPNTVTFFTSFPLTFTLGSTCKIVLLPLSSLLIQNAAVFFLTMKYLPRESSISQIFSLIKHSLHILIYLLCLPLFQELILFHLLFTIAHLLLRQHLNYYLTESKWNKKFPSSVFCFSKGVKARFVVTDGGITRVYPKE